MAKEEWNQRAADRSAIEGRVHRSATTERQCKDQKIPEALCFDVKDCPIP